MLRHLISLIEFTLVTITQDLMMVKYITLGNPYEMYWNDISDTRGFHIFDTETIEHTPIDNPHKMFYNIYYEDTNHQTFDTRKYDDKIVKLIVRRNRSNKV